MFQKILIAAVAMALSGAVVLAAGPVEVRSFDGYVKDVSEKTGKSEKEVRDEAVEALRKEGKYSDDELERIGRDERLDEDRQIEIIDTLKKSESFQVRSGLSAIRNESISKKAGDAFDTMKDESAKPADKAFEKTADKSADFKSTKELESDVVFLADISKGISSKAMDAIKSVAPQNYVPMKKLGKMLLDRVKEDAANSDANLKKDPNWKPLDAAKAEKLLQDVANSPRALEGNLVIGEGAYGACMKMKAEAIENLDDFIEGGNSEGKDPQSYTKGMGRRAAEKFKQDLEEGIFRVCTLASSGCRLFSGAIVNACKTLGSGAK